MSCSHEIHVDKGTWYLLQYIVHDIHHVVYQENWDVVSWPVALRYLKHSAWRRLLTDEYLGFPKMTTMLIGYERVEGLPNSKWIQLPPKMDTWTTKYHQMCGPFSLNMLEQCKCHKSKKLPRNIHHSRVRRAKMHGPLQTQFHQTPTFQSKKSVNRSQNQQPKHSLYPPLAPILFIDV